MLFPPRLVGSALGGLKKKFDLISLKKIRTPLGKEHGESRRKEVEEDMEGSEIVNEKKSVRGRQ